MTLSTRRTAAATGLSERQVRGYVRAGIVTPDTGPRGAFRFTFQDVVILKKGRSLNQAGIPTRRIHREMAHLRSRGRPLGLSAFQITTQGGRLVVQDARGLWEPTTGQLHIPFDDLSVGTLGSPPRPGLPGVTLLRRGPTRPSVQDGDWWFEEALRLEEDDALGARAAYRESIAHDPGHASAHANLGRLLHEQGSLAAAESHYRQALLSEPDDATAAYNLGVVLEDLGDTVGALASYLSALASDPELAQAHFNAGRLLEARGDKAEALGHFVAYRRMEHRT